LTAQRQGAAPAARRGVAWWWARGLELLFPNRCAACEVPLWEAPNGWFCAPCWRGVALPERGVCACCGVPLPGLDGLAAPAFPPAEAAAFAPLPAAGATCLECRKARPPFDRARALGVYDGALKEGVKLLKYGHQTALAHALVAVSPCPGPLWVVDVVAPVPLHPSRLRKRGYNQSAWLARALGERVGLPVEDLLERAVATRPQVGLNRQARAANVKGAFVVPRPDRVAGRTVLLVDDVITTGATAAACAGTLKAAGAERVHVWAVARQGLA